MLPAQSGAVHVIGRGGTFLLWRGYFVPGFGTIRSSESGRAFFDDHHCGTVASIPGAPAAGRTQSGDGGELPAGGAGLRRLAGGHAGGSGPTGDQQGSGPILDHGLLPPAAELPVHFIKGPNPSRCANLRNPLHCWIAGVPLSPVTLPLMP